MKISKQGLAFLGDHEGCPLKAYRCPAGVVTIGYGFTMRSRIFAGWWKAKHGRSLKLGDRISKADADMLLRKLVDEEYGAAVNQAITPRVQHHYDGAASVAYNCGPGALKWTWAQLLKALKVPESAARLRATAVTANGRRLAGLVRRRKEEAALIEHGRYAGQRNASVSALSEDVMQLQKQLAALGYEPGVVDGVSGPKTKAAVRAFQEHQDLEIDGIAGPATRAALIRALDAKRTGQAAKAAPVAAGGGVAGPELVQAPADVLTGNPDLLLSAALWGGGALLLVGAASLIVRYRGAITGRRVPT